MVARTFKYDPFGRRIEKISPTTTSIFAYDSDNLIGPANSSGGVVARYSQGLNIDEPPAVLRSSTTASNFLSRSDGCRTPKIETTDVSYRFWIHPSA